MPSLALHRPTLATGHLARRMAALVLAVLVAACQAQPLASGGPPQKAPAGGGRAAEAALLQRIEAEIGQAACSSGADCRTLAVGSKACGGPARWMAWSATASDGERLQAWAQDLAQRQRRREEAEGLMSTCSIVPDPGASCTAGRCTLARGASAR
jgi:hypothetical protein